MMGNFSKMFFIFFLILFCLTSCEKILSTRSSVEPLHVEGKWIKDSKGNEVILRGIAITDLDAIYKGHRENPNNPPPPKTSYLYKIIDILKEPIWDNVEIVRLTIHPEVEDETGSHGWLHYTPEDYFKNILKPAVDRVKSQKRYVIVDWHYIGTDWNDANVRKNTTEFWNFVADKFADDPAVLFELFNEPGGGEWNDWQKTAQIWVDAIRSGDWSNVAKELGVEVNIKERTKLADNIIIVGGPFWTSRLPAGSTDEFFSGKNIVYACHIYPEGCRNDKPTQIEYTVQYHPVMITEWGYENNSDANVTVGTYSCFGKPLRDYLNSIPNVSWIVWCFDYVYRPVMFDTNWILLGNGNSTEESRFHGGVKDTYENYMGQFVADWLNDKERAKKSQHRR